MLKFLRDLLVFEVLVVTVFVGLFAAILLDRVRDYQEAAEKANMELVISSVRSALRMRLATMLIQGKVSQYSSLEDQNPMDWLDQKPVNYQGELQPDALSSDFSGTWYFDRESKALVYRIERDRHFKLTDRVNVPEVRFQVRLVADHFNKSQDGAPLIVGVRLMLMTPYQWM